MLLICNQQLLHILEHRIYKIHELLTFWRYCQICHHHIAMTGDQIRQQAVARNGYNNDIYAIAGFFVFVQFFFDW